MEGQTISYDDDDPKMSDIVFHGGSLVNTTVAAVFLDIYLCQQGNVGGVPRPASSQLDTSGDLLSRLQQPPLSPNV